MNSKNPNATICNPSPWADNANTIWLGSTLSLTRNLEKFKFPSKLPADKRKQILALLSKELLASSILQKPQILKAEDMRPVEKEFLMEHFLTMHNFQQAHSGEAFLVDQSGEFLGIFNLRDHLVLQTLDVKEELEYAWDRLSRLETALNQSLSFAFSPKFGFLTSDPAQCGTGFSMQVFLHVPALIYTDRLEELLQRHKDDSIEYTGLQGNPHEIIGDIIVFRNNYTLGITEENILVAIRSLTTKVLVEEKSMRVTLRDQSDSEMKDKISRAYAILLHSYQIEAVEALHAISLLKLGLDLDWLTGMTHQALNELLFNCRRAHLLCHYAAEVSQEEIPHRRAEFIHKALKGAQLHI